MKLELFFSCPIPVLSLESLQSKIYHPSYITSFLTSLHPSYLFYVLYFFDQIQAILMLPAKTLIHNIATKMVLRWSTAQLLVCRR